MPGGRGSTGGSGKGSRLTANQLQRKKIATEIEEFFKKKPGLQKKIENNPELRNAFNRLIQEREELNQRLKIRIPISGIYVKEVSSVIKKIPEIEGQLYSKYIIKPILNAGVKEKELNRYLTKVNHMFGIQSKSFLKTVNNIINQSKQQKQTVRIMKDKQGKPIKRFEQTSTGRRTSVKSIFELNELLQSSRITKETKSKITAQHKKYIASLKQISEIISSSPNLLKLEHVVKNKFR